MRLAAFHVEAGHFGRAPRHDDWAIILLGQALQPRARVHRFANGGDNLRTRRSRRADNGSKTARDFLRQDGKRLNQQRTAAE
jgi:hypothetical protein